MPDSNPPSLDSLMPPDMAAKAELVGVKKAKLDLLSTFVLAVWMSFPARTVVDRVAVIVPPIAAFMAVGFEHCIANIYYVPYAMAIKAFAPEAFWNNIGKTLEDFASINLTSWLTHNLLPVTLGNIVGGSLMVGVVYWFVYLRHAQQPTTVADNK